MTPKEKAREIINRMLNDAGWKIVDRDIILLAYLL